jgi:cell division protein FtsB
MRSQLAEAARRSLREDVKRMTAEQRLSAFLAHCQLLAQLNGAGGALDLTDSRRSPNRAEGANSRDRRSRFGWLGVV